MKHPENFFFKEYSTGISGGKQEVFGVSFADNRWKDQGVHNPSLSIRVIKTDLSPREWLEKYYDRAVPPILGDIPEPSTGYENIEETTINGMPAIQFRLLATSDLSESIIIQKKPSLLFHISAISSGIGNFPEELRDQILSTFRFVK